MIPPELRAEIRRLYFAEHWRVGTIASELKVHHEAVRHAIGLNLTSRDTSFRRMTEVAPYKDFIAQVLEKHRRLRATRLLEMIKARGYEGGIAQLRRFVRTVRPANPVEAFLRLNTLPGEQAQVDWAAFGKIRVGSAERTLSCFVCVLSWSRAMYARFTFDQTLENFLRGHIEAFEAIGGVPRTILYDNLKSVVLERIGDSIRFHPRLLEFAGHYHFAPKPCAPYRGNEKGKVERQIRYLRDSFFAARTFSSIDDLNAQLKRWIEEIAHSRKAPGRDGLVADALTEERPRLLPLPQHPFETDRVTVVSSGKTPYVRFDGNDYSIPHAYIKKPLTLVASEHVLKILDGTSAEIAKHQRSYDKGKTIEDAGHIAALLKEKHHAHDIRGRDLLRTVCKNADAFFLALADRGDPITIHSFRLQGLLKRYGARDLDRAIAEAMSRGAIGADAVAHILDQKRRGRRQPPPLEVVLPERVREMIVKPHSLAGYDQLGTNDSTEGGEQ